MNTRRIVRTIASLVIAAAALAASVPAAAQTTRPRPSQTTLPDDVVREVLRIVNASIPADLGREISDAVRDATRHLGTLHAIPPGAAQNRDFRVEKTARETKTYKLGTAGTLDLRNISGTITVTGTGGQDATIEIVRLSRGRTDADAQLGLDRVKATAEQRGERVTVETEYPDDRRPPYSVEVSYTVKAPAGTRVTASSIGGNINITDIKGDISASTTGGDTTVTGGRSVSAKSVGGSVTINGADTDSLVEAETFGGEIKLLKIKAHRIQANGVGGNVTATDITCESADLGTVGGDVDFSGPLSRNGRYELHSNAGEVRFTPLGNVGYDLQASTFAGDIRADGITIQMQSSISGRGPNRSLRGTVGDGGAVVILRTFSGTVTVIKK